MTIQKFNNTFDQLPLLYQSGSHADLNTYTEFLAGRAAGINARIYQAIFTTTAVSNTGGARVSLYDSSDSSSTSLVPDNIPGGTTVSLLRNVVLTPDETLRLAFGTLEVGYLLEAENVAEKIDQKYKKLIRKMYVCDQIVPKDENGHNTQEQKTEN